MHDAVLIALIAFLAYMADFFGYSQYDRPLCTGVLVGLALGDVQTGLIVGASLELVYMGTMTIGGAFPPDIYTGGILGTAFAITTGTGVKGLWPLSLPIGSLALLIVFIYLFVRGAITHKADRYAEVADDKGVARMHIVSMLAYCIPMAILVGLSFYVGGPAVQALLDAIPEFIMRGLSAASGIIPALGFAMLIKMIINKDVAPYFFIGFIIAAYLEIPIIGIAAIAIMIALLVVNKNQTVVVEGDMDDDF